ncbi:LytTR family DNA-binding domain-containing protein [Konateibacter massiliensis]|uniref:LytTR family DNA-binding domain-containing protein n=1 Tax=Konateibacter massiliensis TaxID=2002841 RepID=UPI000C1615F6|nr:LytTR family DNA-binding domain-containing protein [Konateibacter massiliensis]
MKVIIKTEADTAETEVAITCNHLTPEIEKIVAMLRMLDMQLTGVRDGATHILDVANVLYIDTVDKKVFLYTRDSVYETNLHLYELEEQLTKADFFRANKSCIINFKQIVSLKADMDRKLRATMSNGEQLMISRQYADYVKERLGVK